MEQYIIEFSEFERKILSDLTTHITAIPSSDPEMYCCQVKQLSREIPQRIRERLHNFSKKGTQRGYLLFQTGIVSAILTPNNNTSQIGEKTTLSKIQALLICCISEMIAYEAEGQGGLFQDIVPIKSMEKKQTSVGSNTELEIHTEQAFSRLRPDILSLSCLKGDPEAITYILPVQKIIKHMTGDEIGLLREQLWKTGVDLSFKLHGKEFAEGDVRGPMPILYGNEDDPFLIFDQDLMTSNNEIGEHLIKKIVEIYYQERNRHNLTPGEIIFIDNRRAVHGRSPFFPKYDGADRFLVRCFATFDYEKSGYARKRRMVNAIYS
jgi:L-asparagine oxygenase